jgi:hypothetical protein
LKIGIVNPPPFSYITVIASAAKRSRHKTTGLPRRPAICGYASPTSSDLSLPAVGRDRPFSITLINSSTHQLTNSSHIRMHLRFNPFESVFSVKTFEFHHPFIIVLH